MERVETESLNKEELMRRFFKARLELFKSVEGLSDDQLAGRIYDVWTVKDVIAHFIAWDVQSVLDAKAIIENRPEDVFAGDEDEFNANAAMQFKNIAGSDLIQKFQEMTVTARRFMEETGELDLFRQALIGDEIKYAASGFNFAHHDIEHAEDINKWRKERGYVQSNQA